MQALYSAGEIRSLLEIRGTERDIETRRPVKITRHYFELAKNSLPLQTLVKASPRETWDLSGAPDPGKQTDYSPVEGVVHKYEIALIYVASTCSAHCRFCYREELIARKDVKRSDGTIALKGLARIPEAVKYVRTHNEAVAANGAGIPRRTGNGSGKSSCPAATPWSIPTESWPNGERRWLTRA